MAYSDYGAFVYKDGKRRHDKEDAPALVTDDIMSVGNGLRIYAQISDIMDGEEKEDWETIYHGILGDGHVRVALYKTGVYNVHVYVFGDDWKLEADYSSDDIRRMCRVEPAEFPYYRDGMTEEEKAKWRREYDAYYGSTDNGYDWSFEVKGAKIRLSWKPPENVNGWSDSAKLDMAPAHASMVEADGGKWDAWYGPMYGAGLADVDVFGNNVNCFDEIVDGAEPQYNVLSICDRTVRGDECDLDVIYDAAGNVLAASAIDTVEDENGHIKTAWAQSTLSSSKTSYVDAQTFANILNMGIALAHAGYHCVEYTHECHANVSEAYQDAYDTAFPTAEDEKAFLNNSSMNPGNLNQYDMAKAVIRKSFKFAPFDYLREDDDDDEE